MVDVKAHDRHQVIAHRADLRPRCRAGDHFAGGGPDNLKELFENWGSAPALARGGGRFRLFPGSASFPTVLE
jgi:hypothetical protein